MDLTALLASVAASVITVVGGLVVARKFQKLGGGEAQERLNAIRKELDDAMTEKVSFLEEQFAGCKKRLGEVENQLKAVRAERIELKQEIGDLHEEIRDLRPDRRGARDRTNDR